MLPMFDPHSRPGRATTPERPSSSLEAQVARLAYRLSELERTIGLTSRPDRVIEVARWGSATDAPVVGYGRVYRVQTGGDVYEFDADLRVSGTGSTTIDLYVAGVNVATATIASGATQSAPITISGVRATVGTQLWVNVTSVASGSLGLAVNARMAA